MKTESSKNLNDPKNRHAYAADFVQKKIDEKKLIRLVPYGVSVAIPQQPALLLKGEVTEHIMPVPLSSIEAGLSLAVLNKTVSAEHVHAFSEQLLKLVNLKIKKCLFVEIKGSHQYVKLFFEKNPLVASLKVRADECISFCLAQNIPIFASTEYMTKSRVMTANMEVLTQEMSMYPDVVLRKNTYMN